MLAVGGENLPILKSGRHKNKNIIVILEAGGNHSFILETVFNTFVNI